MTDEGVLPLFLPSECPDCIGTSSSLSLLRLCPTARKSVRRSVGPFNGEARSRAERDEGRFQACAFKPYQYHQQLTVGSLVTKVVKILPVNRVNR